MTVQDDTKKPARNAVLTARYARVWKAIVSGTAPARRENVAGWYATAQHPIGVCMHEAHLAQIPQADGDTRDDANRQHAA